MSRQTQSAADFLFAIAQRNRNYFPMTAQATELASQIIRTNTLTPESQAALCCIVNNQAKYYSYNAKDMQWYLRHDRDLILMIVDGLHFINDHRRNTVTAALAELLSYLHDFPALANESSAITDEIDQLYSLTLNDRINDLAINIRKNSRSEQTIEKKSSVDGHILRLSSTVRHIQLTQGHAYTQSLLSHCKAHRLPRDIYRTLTN